GRAEIENGRRSAPTGFFVVAAELRRSSEAATLELEVVLLGRRLRDADALVVGRRVGRRHIHLLADVTSAVDAAGSGVLVEREGRARNQSGERGDQGDVANGGHGGGPLKLDGGQLRSRRDLDAGFEGRLPSVSMEAGEIAPNSIVYNL